MKATNLLFIMSDEHNKRMLGCYGHPMIRTPNLDGHGGKEAILRRGTFRYSPPPGAKAAYS